MEKLKLLHVGCGPKTKKQTTNFFNNDNWEETRIDVDTSCKPDVVGSMTDMNMFANSTFDAIYSSHNFEHLFAHEAEIAAKEFFRVLKPTGYLLLLCPDILAACKAVYEKGPDSVLYSTANGTPISPIDVVYGWGRAIKNGNEFMAHKYGYSEKTLISVFKKAGFSNMASTSRKGYFDIVLLACRESLYNENDMELNHKNIKELFTNHLK
jgi:SAM-dependent methyltransferase